MPTRQSKEFSGDQKARGAAVKKKPIQKKKSVIKRKLTMPSVRKGEATYIIRSKCAIPKDGHSFQKEVIAQVQQSVQP